MSFQVTLDLPAHLMERLRREGSDLNSEVKEAFVLDLFRRGRLSHRELAEVLGCDRFETDAFLRRHQAFEGALTMADLEADRETLTRVLRKDSDAGRR